MTQPQEQQDTLTEEALAALILASVLAPWLAAVGPAVMASPWPDPSAIFRFDQQFERAINRLMPVLARLARPGWLRTNAELDVRTPFSPNDPELLEVLAQTRNLLVGIPNRVYREVVNAMATGRDLGEDVARIRRRVDNILTVTGSVNWPDRALVIARTEVGRFTEAGALASARHTQAVERSTILKRWRDRDDDRVRRGHARVDNQLRRLGEPFHVGRSQLQHPIDPSGHPDDVINCVPGTSITQAAGVEAIFRFQFNGPVLTLRGKSGFSSTVSVNHPVVTEFGWVPACKVKEGDNLLRTRSADFSLRVPEPHPDGSMATIEEIYNSLTLSGMPHGVVSLPVNFYGDIPAAQVEVVFTNGLLGINIDPQGSEHFNQLCLACADLPDPPGSPGFKAVNGDPAAPDGVMGPGDLTGPLRLGHSGPLDSFGFRSVSQHDPGLPEPLREGSAGQTLAIRDLLDRTSGQVFLDEIIEVVRHDFAGHLYTLQTKSGIYMSDNTVSHNCRCRLEYVRVR